MTKRQGATTDIGFIFEKVNEITYKRGKKSCEPFWRQFGNIGVLVNLDIQGVSRFTI